MTRPQPSTSSVEAVARAIDPEAWQAFDEQANRRSWNAFERAEAMIAGKRLAKSLDAACRVLAAPLREALVEAEIMSAPPKSYLIEVTMPSGEKLPPLYIDRDAFTLTRADEVGRAIGYEIGRLVEQRLKA